MSENVTVTIDEHEVYRDITTNNYDSDCLLKDAIKYLQTCMEKIPKKYRDSAVLEINHCGSYEESSECNIRVYYSRPETEKEAKTRQKNAASYLERQRQREYVEYLELKKKFEDEK